jgi:hypothetical protein
VAGHVWRQRNSPGWVDPLHGRVHSAIRDFDRSAIADLAARTTRLALAVRDHT